MSTRKERKARALKRNCNNCGKSGPHYVGPSFGDRGFYACTPTETTPPEHRHEFTSAVDDARTTTEGASA